jgi:uncharacterized membrane protein
MPGLSYGTDTTHPDQQHHMDFLANIPQSTSLLIELDLRGIDRPRFIPLSENLPATLQPQKPDTAQIFLCASSADAISISQHREIESTAEYIKRVASDSKSWADEPLIVPYDPRCLFDWLSIQPGQVRKILLPEYVAIPSKPRADYPVVHSQIHMVRGTEDKYTAVWFDFRDLYKFNDHFGITQFSDEHPGLSVIPVSTWQRRFAYGFQGLLCRTICHVPDFPRFLLLDILRTDVLASEEFVSVDQRVPPVTTHASVVPGYHQKRLDSFEHTQSMLRKAEGIHRLVTYMNSPQALDLVAHGSRPSYEQSLHRLEIGSSFMISELRRQDEMADKRLDTYNQFAQLRQASSLSAITYCAAFFLPLSLAGTFLSMQSRAQDLHLMVYDFCGMAIIFCSIAGFVYFVFWAWSTRKTGRLTRNFEEDRFGDYMLSRFHHRRNLLSGLWMLVVASFLVGMLHDFRLGLILLAALPAFVILYILCAGIIAFVMCLFEAIKSCVAPQGRAKDDIEAGKE